MSLIAAVQDQQLPCQLIAHGNAPHLAQLHTGFAMLAQSGRIRLKYEFRDFRWGGHLISRRQPQECGLYILIDGQRLIYCDMRDGAGLNAQALEIADLYFKRSYSPETTPTLYQRKIMPLGLNYEVYPDSPSIYAIQSLIAYKTFSKSFLRTVVQLASQVTGYPFLPVPKVSRLSAEPTPTIEPRTLFMVRAWDPEHEKDLSEAEKEERRTINEMRAACIRLLRKSFGQRFTGGFSHTPYAAKIFKDALLANPEIAHKDRYLNLVKTHPICIATTGLHGSIGWKFGEYVAFSRAIVSEKLNFLPPENFAQGQHYLDFATPDECVNATEKLMSDASLRSLLMNNNQIYYRQFLKPDALVWRALTIAKAWSPITCNPGL